MYVFLIVVTAQLFATLGCSLCMDEFLANRDSGHSQFGNAMAFKGFEYVE
jgi:hypothetical protein